MRLLPASHPRVEASRSAQNTERTGSAVPCRGSGREVFHAVAADVEEQTGQYIDESILQSRSSFRLGKVRHLTGTKMRTRWAERSTLAAFVWLQVRAVAGAERSFERKREFVEPWGKEGISGMLRSGERVVASGREDGNPCTQQQQSTHV